MPFNHSVPAEGGNSARPQLLDMVRCDWRREVLGNGLVVLLSRDETTPLVHLGIGYRVGSMDEGPRQTGLAHMFEHLMFGGTKQLPGSFISRMIHAGTIDINAMTGRDITRYYQTLPHHLLEFALFAEADRMGNFLESIDSAALERERNVILEEKKETEAQMMGRLYLWLAEGMLAVGHPYRHPTIGYAQDIAGYTLDDVRAWYRTHYTPANAVLVVSGGIDPDAVLAMVDRHFGHIPAGPLPQRITARVETVVRSSAMRVHDRIGVPGIFYQGWSTPSEVASPRESTALSLAAQLLAGDRSSDLHRRLVTDGDLATQVSGYHMAGQASGTMMIDATLRARPDGRIGAAITEGVMAFADTPIPAERLELVQSKQLISTIRSLVSFERKARILMEGEILHDDPGWFRSEAQLVDSINESEIRAATRTWLGSGAFGLSIEPMPQHRAPTRPAPTMPVPGDSATAVVRSPQWIEATLSNGARVRVSQRPNDPTFQLLLHVVGGQAAETPGLEGVAKLIAGTLEFGAGHDDGPALATRLGRAHLSASMFAPLTSILLHVDGLRGALPGAAELVADVMIRPRYGSTEFGRHMASTKASSAMAANTPQRRSTIASFRALLGDRHRLSAPLLVSPELAVSDIERYHAQVLRPENSMLLLAGDIDPAVAFATLETALAGWTAPPASVTPHRLSVEPARPGIHLYDMPGRGTVEIALLWRTRSLTDAERVAFSCLGHILGGSFTSRANTRLRSELAWTYGVQGGTGRFAPLGGPDYGLLKVAVNEAHVGEALQEIETLIAGLCGDAPATDVEINSFRRSERDRLSRLNETAGRAVETMREMFEERLAGPGDWLTRRDYVESLNEAKVGALARELLPTRGAMVCTLTGDVSQIRRSLALSGLEERIVDETVD